MTIIQYRFAIRTHPDIHAKTAELLPDFLIAPGIFYYSTYLSRGADYAFPIQYSLCITVIIGSNLVKTKIVEALEEDFPFFQNDIPAEAALHALQGQWLEHLTVIVHRDTPFRIMIYFVGLVYVGPSAVTHLAVLHIRIRLFVSP